MAITPAMIMGGMSLAGGLAGMFGGDHGGSGGAQSQQSNMWSNMGNQFGYPGAIGGINSLGAYNLGGQNLGQFQNILEGTVENPYKNDPVWSAQQFQPGIAQNAQQGMGNASMMSGQVPQMLGDANTMRGYAPQMAGMAGQMAGYAPQLTGMAGQLINSAFDPQNALYQRTADQTQQQQLAGLQGSGLASTPWGQGVLGNTMGNFNIDWQNNQLQRQLQGAQGAGSLYGEAGGMLQGAGGLYGQAGGMLQGAGGLTGQAGGLASGAFGLGNQAGMAGAGSGMLPYSAYNTVGTNQLNALTGGSAYGQSASQIPQTGIGDWLQLINAGNQSGQLGLNQQQQQFKQNQTYGQDIGAGMYGMFGGRGGGPASTMQYGGQSWPMYG